MITFNFLISNPWSNTWNLIWGTNGLLTTHKAWELNLYRTDQIINIEFCLSINCDHAGLNTKLGLFGYTLEYTVYDTRHWDYENNTWEIYDREEENP